MQNKTKTEIQYDETTDKYYFQNTIKITQDLYNKQ